MKQNHPAGQKHPRNPHNGRYDFKALISGTPELAAFVAVNQWGSETIDFADPAAVKALNRALLKFYYQVEWDIPDGYLCPPIPGRADYLHYCADLLAEGNRGTVPTGAGVTVLDIGTGANCVYPVIGASVYGWRFTASEIDRAALEAARRIIEHNPKLVPLVELRSQNDAEKIFTGIIQSADRFDLSICNPPFHASAEAAEAASTRKHTNLGSAHPERRNFGGTERELWCPGGEKSFIYTMINESKLFASQCRWFSTLVSKSENLSDIYRQLEKIGATEVRTINMAQGQKTSRIVAWSFTAI